MLQSFKDLAELKRFIVRIDLGSGQRGPDIRPELNNKRRSIKGEKGDRMSEKIISLFLTLD